MKTTTPQNCPFKGARPRSGRIRPNRAPSKRRRALGVGTTINTRAFVIRFDGAQGELFQPIDSNAWTILKPGHPKHQHQFHAPTYLNRKEIVAMATRIIQHP